jgi:hypothetical protein
MCPNGKAYSAPVNEVLSGLFRESGKWTLKANLESETLEQISKVYDLLLKKVDNIVKANSSQ